MSNCHLVAGRSLIDLVASRLALRAQIDCKPSSCSEAHRVTSDRTGGSGMTVLFQCAAMLVSHRIIANAGR